MIDKELIKRPEESDVEYKIRLCKGKDEGKYKIDWSDVIALLGVNVAPDHFRKTWYGYRQCLEEMGEISKLVTMQEEPEVKEEKTTLKTIVEKRKELQYIYDEILKLLSKESLTTYELSELLNITLEEIEEHIIQLKLQGYNIVNYNGFYKIDKQMSEYNNNILLDFYEDTFKFGFCTDTHGGSIHEQLTSLHKFYDLCEQRGIEYVFNAGDIVAGINMFRGQERELHAHGCDEQEEHVINNYPKRKGIKTLCIAGNHDYSYLTLAGRDVVKGICNRRDDMQYLGMMSGNITLPNGLRIKLLHPDGGVPYSKSYRGQKINEALGRGENLPHIQLLGHTHTALYNPYLGIHDFMGGCFESQNTWEERKGLNPQIGGWIIEVNFKDGFINRLQNEWIEFKPIEDGWKL